MLRKFGLAWVILILSLAQAYALTGDRILKSPEWFIVVLASKMGHHAKCKISESEMLEIIVRERELNNFVTIQTKGSTIDISSRLDRGFNGLLVLTDIWTDETISASLFRASNRSGNQFYTTWMRDVAVDATWYDEALVIDIANRTVGPHLNSVRSKFKHDYPCTFLSQDEVSVTAQEPIRRAIGLLQGEWFMLTDEN